MVKALDNLKICGITEAATARLCAELGIGAVGVVFYPRSPRAVTPYQARAILRGLPERVARVGVFVDMPVEGVVKVARQAGVGTVQLHGREPDTAVRALHEAGLHVVKALKCAGEKLVETAQTFPQTTHILVECSLGELPGGNGVAWDWGAAAVLAGVRPFVVAGGLTPPTLREAAERSGAVGWDLSSGVELAPGRKDPAAIKAAADAVAALNARETVFWRKARV